LICSERSRFALAAPISLVLPGYAIAAALFPGRSLEAVERWLLSGSLSVASTMLVGVGLHAAGELVDRDVVAEVVRCVDIDPHRVVVADVDQEAGTRGGVEVAPERARTVGGADGGGGGKRHHVRAVEPMIGYERDRSGACQPCEAGGQR
jgi:hypothetical protein